MCLETPHENGGRLRAQQRKRARIDLRTASNATCPLQCSFLAFFLQAMRGRRESSTGALHFVRVKNTGSMCSRVSPSGAYALFTTALYEIYYQLVGGRVDFGKRTPKSTSTADTVKATKRACIQNGLRNIPSILLGTLLAEARYRMLQHLLDSGFFGNDKDGTWIASISTISAPLNGARAVYAFGAKVRRKYGERSTVVPMSPRIHSWMLCPPHILLRYQNNQGSFVRL